MLSSGRHWMGRTRFYRKLGYLMFRIENMHFESVIFIEVDPFINGCPDYMRGSALQIIYFSLRRLIPYELRDPVADLI